MQTWKPIPGYESYLISNYGLVKREKILKPWEYKDGYKRISLSKNGNVKKKYVHHIVAEVFIGKRLKNMDINHIDGDKNNNKLNNLEYVSHSQNMIHAINNGKMRHDRRKDIKLKDYQINEIRESYSKGNIKQKDLAKIYNVGRSHICQIISKKRRK